MAGARAEMAGGSARETAGAQRGADLAPRATGARSPVVRATALAAGFALAIGGSVAAFLTEDPLFLRLAVLGVVWAFVIAAIAAGGRRADRIAASGREQELRHSYDLELEREVAARREYELRLENQLRREAQEAMRAEVEAMRRDLSALSQLRGELQDLSALRHDLRNDMSRMRAELTEQLSGEMLVERIVMRTQSIRMPADRPSLDQHSSAVLDGAVAEQTHWADEVDDDRDTAWGDGPPVPIVSPRTEQVPRLPVPAPVRPVPPTAPPVPPVRSQPGLNGHQTPDHLDQDRAPAVEWLESQPLVERGGTQLRPPAEPAADLESEAYAEPESGRRHRRALLPDDAVVPMVVPAAGPQPPPEPPVPTPTRGAHAYDTAQWSEPGTQPGPSPAEPEPSWAPPAEDAALVAIEGHDRLTQILAENGVNPQAGRRRRRREDGEQPEDDVLARVLGR